MAADANSRQRRNPRNPTQRLEVDSRDVVCAVGADHPGQPNPETENRTDATENGSNAGHEDIAADSTPTRQSESPTAVVLAGKASPPRRFPSPIDKPGGALLNGRVSVGTIRILSDIHLGDRSSRVATPAQLRPLFENVSELVLNGDSLDTRPGPAPEATAGLRATLGDFFSHHAPPTRLVTGNHDPDISPLHFVDLADQQVFVVHGDIFFHDIVPWSADAPLLRALIESELAALPADARGQLSARLGAWRRAAGQVPQRHQSERHGLKYLVRFAADTVWPPLRIVRILRAWREEPARAFALLRQHRPTSKFIITGHTHRPGWWQSPDGVVHINTGSFCPPLGGFAVDVEPARLVIRRVTVRAGSFHAAEVVATFALAAA